MVVVVSGGGRRGKGTKGNNKNNGLVGGPTPVKKGVKTSKPSSSSPTPSVASTSTSMSSVSSTCKGKGQGGGGSKKVPTNMSECNGPRIQAQRKFAQAGNIYVGTLNCNSSTSQSPYVTPSKEVEGVGSSSSNHGSAVKKVKKPVFSPPPVKRPKTEDFLTFLCVRGTPSLPPELDFFNYPQVFETCIPEVQPKKKLPTVDSETTTDTHHNKSNGKSSKIQASKTKAEVVASKVKKAVEEERKTVASSIARIAENPTKGIRATASSVLLSKLKKTSPVSKAKPILSPPRGRLNEQDARKALTALKLKYQRLAFNNNTNRSALLTKKAKESIILTRSKSSRSSLSQAKSSPRKIPRQMKPVVISPSRNAPSPDIIFGVTSCVSAARKRARSKSSSDEDEEDESGSDDKPAESSSENEDEDEESVSEQSEAEKVPPSKGNQHTIPATKSLRNGKDVKKKSRSPTPQKKSDTKRGSDDKERSSDRRRVGTRSAHRLTKSPFREIPMYKPEDSKEKSKRDTKCDKDKKNKSQDKDKKDKKSASKNDNQKDRKRDKSPKKNDDGKRPSRKTKETATNLLGLLTREFSTDEDNSSDENRNGKNDISEGGSSSSSEAEYLEKHYNAALRREEEKFLNISSENKARTSRRLSSKGSDNSGKKATGRKLRNQKSLPKDENSRKKQVKKKDEEKSPISTRTRTRARQSTPTVGDRKMPGAARKSASVTTKGRRGREGSTSEEDQDSDGGRSTEDSESEDEDDSGHKVETQKSRTAKKQMEQPKKKSKHHKNKSSDASEEDDEESGKSENELSSDDSESENVKRDISKTAKKIIQLRTKKNSKSEDTKSSKRAKSRRSSTESSSESERESKLKPAKGYSKSKSKSPEKSPLRQEQMSSSDSETSSDDESVPEKVDMAIQVDMDEEDGIVTPSMCLTDNDPPRKHVPKQEHGVTVDNDSDDSVQEIGHVFSSNSTGPFPSRTKVPASLSSQHSARTQGASSTSSPFCHNHHHTSPMQPQPPPIFSHSGPTIDSLHNNAFNPFMPPQLRPLQPEFYTPLQLAPPLVHSSIQLVGSSLGVGHPSFPLTSPLNTLSIPVSVPFSSHLLPPPPPALGFATGSTFHSTTLQTQTFRSVASNLDVPLVRPMVGHNEHASMNVMSRGFSANTPLTRPSTIGAGVSGVWGNSGPVMNTVSRNHYSAFRVPHLGGTTTHTQHVIHHQSTTVLGMNSTPVLPVSIIQPQVHHQQPTSGTSTSSSWSKPAHKEKSKSASSSSSSNTTKASSTPSSENKQRPRSPTPPGYHLIKHLPNVSIVPKFDRNAHQSNQDVKGSKRSGKTDQREPGEKKKVGRKPKEAAVLPQPSSPLTVRKDSNPATYAPKKTSKRDEDKDSLDIKEEEDHASSDAAETSESTQTKGLRTNDSADDFTKLLKKKKDRPNRSSPAPSSSSNSSVKRGTSESPNVSKKGKIKDAEPKPSTSRTASPNVGKSKNSVKVSEETGIAVSLKGISDAPAFYPTDQEFEDPLRYMQKIQQQAEKHGMARIVPPKSFRPECNVEDDMRFSAYNHYVHKMYQRWGPNVLENEAIKQNLKQNQVDLSESPMIGGMEIDLATLYQTVKSFGGLTEVIAKQRWTKVADTMHVPKAAHDRATKLDAIYVKYVLPYESLSEGERDKLKKKVEKKWNKRKDKILKAAENADEEDLEEDSMDELDECIVKGKTTPLNAYYRVARNTLNVFFPNETKEPTCGEIEEEYWKIVRDRNRHVCVYSGSIDCAGVGWGFPIPKANNKHPWNLKALANNQGSVLRSMGSVMGATVPTLHVAMLFTSYCWYRDPHCLPWIEYLHSGAKKIWYSVPSMHEDIFRSALTELMPMQCKKKNIWLPSDSAMIPLEVLVEKGVPLVRAVQHPGEFLVVFPKSFTSAVCTGYLISESVYFAYPSWLKTCTQTFKDIVESKEPPVFPLEKLLLCILQDARAPLDVVRSILPQAKDVVKEELALRKKLASLGVKNGGKMSSDGSSSSKKSAKKKPSREEEIEQCHSCNYTLHLSVVRNNKTDAAMCLKHALEHFIKHKTDIKKCNLFFDLDQAQLEHVIENASKRCGTSK